MISPKNKTFFVRVFLLLLFLIGCGISASLYIGKQHIKLGTLIPEKNFFWGFGSDSINYWQLSGSIKETGEFKSEAEGLGSFSKELPFIFNAVRPPAYPFALSVARRIWDNVDIGFILQFIFYALICLYAFFFATSFWKTPSPISLLVFMIFIALSPLLLFYSFGINCEIFACFTSIAFTFHLIKMNQSTSHFSFFHLFSAILFAAACLFTKSNLVLYVFALIFFILITANFFPTNKSIFRANLFIFSISLLAFFCWSYKIYQETGLITVAGYPGNNLYVNYIHFDQNKEEISYKIANTLNKQSLINDEFKKGTNPATIVRLADNETTKIVLQYIRTHPSKTLFKGLHATRMLFFSSYFPISDMLTPIFFKVPQTAKEGHFIDSSKLKEQNPSAFYFLMFLRLLSKIFNILLFLSFFTFPILLILTGLYRPNYLLALIWLCTFFYILSTGFIIGNNGDRHLIAVYVNLMLFFFIALDLIRLLICRPNRH